MATVPIRPLAEPTPAGPLRWIRSLRRRLLAPAGAQAGPQAQAAPGTAPSRHPRTGHLVTPPAGGRPGPPSEGLQEARTAVSALLADVERLHPGLAMHRSLDLQGGSGVRAQALSESFGECDALCATPGVVSAAQSANRHPERCRYLHAGGQALSFPAETFDLVHCGTLSSEQEDAEQVIAEALRVLRLQGVAVADLPGRQPARPTESPLPAVSLLVALPGPGSARLPAGETYQIAVTVTNAGTRVLGSALALPRLQSRWRASDGAPEVAGEVALPGILLPGDSRLTALHMTAPSASGIHALELFLLYESPWGERTSATTTLAVAVGGDSSTMASAPPALDRSLCAAVARANGAMLGARALQPRADLQPWTRYFFARA